jgi:beta-barrel assembly-enhancing protease
MRWPALLLVSSALTLSAQTIPGSGPNFYSREKEAALGAQLAQQVRQTATPVDNNAALSYVEQMGAKLAARFPEPRFTYTFTLIAAGNDDALKEPVALPGGFVFVPASLFLTAQDDSEFAGVLAHAMAHVAARHGTRAATRESIAQMAVNPIIANGGAAGFMARQAADTLIPAALARFSRDYEQEADQLAVNVVTAAGYDAEGLIRYLSREQSNLPVSEARNERMAALQNAIQNLPHPASGELRQIQQQLRNPPRN